MDAAGWLIVAFLVFFTLELGTEMALLLLNLRHVRLHGTEVPPLLRGRFGAETVERSRAYTLARGRLALVRGLYDAGLTLVLLFSGVLPWLDGALAELGFAGANRFVALLAVVAAALSLAHLPFGLYSTFGLEQRFGFNRMTLALWVKDRLKGLMLAAALGLPLLYAIYAFFAYAGAAWWLWVLALLVAWQVVMVWLYPVVIAPLFNKFSPLPEGSFRERLEALAAQAGFRPRGLHVMDASRRSAHSNAYFAGFFRPRIVLFDTLLQDMSEDEALSVLAHEIGHFRAHHVHKRLGLHVAGLAVTLAVLAALIEWPPLFQAFGFAEPTLHAALVLLSLAGGSFVFWMGPLAAWYSRRHEYEADAYSVRLAGLPDALQSALVRLSSDNLSNLNPHPWFSAYHYSHPSLVERLRSIDAVRADQGSGPAAKATAGAQPAAP